MLIISGEIDKVKEKIRELSEESEVMGKKVGVILFQNDKMHDAAHDFFPRLRDFDEQEVDLILAGALDLQDGIGFAVMNRMLKSAGYSIINV